MRVLVAQRQAFEWQNKATVEGFRDTWAMATAGKGWHRLLLTLLPQDGGRLS